MSVSTRCGRPCTFWGTGFEWGAPWRPLPGRQAETGGAMLLCTPEGAVAQLEFGMEHAYRSRDELVGSTGRISVERAFTLALMVSRPLRPHGFGLTCR